MKQSAQLIIIASEVLNGKTLDLNTQALARFLFQRRISLGKVQIIPDQVEAMKQALDLARQETNLIFLSGGLGPTKDDLTKKFLSDYFACPLKEYDEARKIAEDNFLRAKRTYVPERVHYHLFPEKFLPLANPQGLAPGLFHQTSELKLFSLPGVPKEFMAIVEHHIF